MMDEKQFEQDYKKMHTQHVPDLWDRIEAGLEDQPGRTAAAAKDKPLLLRHFTVRRLAAVASFAVLVVGITLSRQARNAVLDSAQSEMMVAETSDAPPLMADEPMGAMAAAEADGNDEAAAAGEADGNGALADAANGSAADSAGRSGAASMMRMNALPIPDNAQTVAADAMYFSEAVLKETDLLCEATIDSVSFGYNESGIADHVVYDVRISGIHYAAGYVAGNQSIVVTSPIVQADADEAYLLYQMKQGDTYLLPLKEAAESWELIYPFAPQIELTAESGYVFHSGYTSLINEQTMVTRRQQESADDYYYDRMLSRQDDTFLSDLTTLVENSVQGRK